MKCYTRVRCYYLAGPIWFCTFISEEPPTINHHFSCVLVVNSGWSFHNSFYKYLRSDDIFNHTIILARGIFSWRNIWSRRNVFSQRIILMDGNFNRRMVFLNRRIIFLNRRMIVLNRRMICFNRRMICFNRRMIFLTGEWFF